MASAMGTCRVLRHPPLIRTHPGRFEFFPLPNTRSIRFTHEKQKQPGWGMLPRLGGRAGHPLSAATSPAGTLVGTRDSKGGGGRRQGPVVSPMQNERVGRNSAPWAWKGEGGPGRPGLQGKGEAPTEPGLPGSRGGPYRTPGQLEPAAFVNSTPATCEALETAVPLGK